MKVLIVEDDTLQRLEREYQVQALGFEYASYADAAAALRAYQHTFYPVIITDMGLPGMDGLELCRRIRTMPHGNYSTILVISGRSEPDDIQAALKAGADDYLSKPVDEQRLHERLIVLQYRCAARHMHSFRNTA